LPLLAVIPAKAGIHFDLAVASSSLPKSNGTMDPGFRRDDDEDMAALFGSTGARTLRSLEDGRAGPVFAVSWMPRQ